MKKIKREQIQKPSECGVWPQPRIACSSTIEYMTQHPQVHHPLETYKELSFIDN
jgi:hypothetical protein